MVQLPWSLAQLSLEARLAVGVGTIAVVHSCSGYLSFFTPLRDARRQRAWEVRATGPDCQLCACC